MVRYHFAAALALVVTALATPLPQTASGTLKPDPAGAKNVGNGQGEQFITGQCLSNADCASGCCATLNDIGICSGPGAAFQAGKQGCGFGSTANNAANSGSSSSSSGATSGASTSGASASGTSASGASASGTSTSGTLKPDPAGAKNVGNGQGGQFITGQCLSNADCASGCCATLNDIGICSGPGAAFQAGKQGCGFGSTANNAGNNAANSGSSSSSSGTTPGSSTSGTLKPDPAGAKNVGNGQGGQFITGQCLGNADCASGCCATLNDIGICSGPGAAFQAGKQGCGFTAAGV